LDKATVGDIEICYQESGEGHPLVLIMGLTATMDWWDPVLLEELSRSYRVIIFDNRGAGRSECPRGDFSIELFADDTVALMDSLGIDRAHVLGYSMGGMVAQELVLRHPQRVGKLMLYATYCGGSDSVFGDKEVLARLVDRSGTVDDLVERSMGLMFSRDWIEDNRAVLDEFKRRYLIAPTPDHVAARQFMATVNFDASDRISGIEKPTLVACGMEDILIPPQNSSLIASKIPDAELIAYPHAGHGFIWQDREQCLEDLADFLG
jgi:pimeloyl-ACP methyl ester carboxylesterase